MSRNPLRFVIFLGLAWLVAGVALPSSTLPAGAQSAQFKRYLRDMRHRAVRRGISRRVVDQAFRGLTPNPKVWELSRYQPEFKLPVWAYLDKTVSDRRIADGRASHKKYQERLKQIEAKYGVPSHYLVAVWGMETNYGQKKGDYHVIRSLATLGYKGRRKFGRQQLMAALKILQRGDIPLKQFYGSWAGAMGHTQFIPTTYNAYAVDWTRDGTRDIWNSISDALASTANYLRVSGWRKGQTWGHEVIVPRRLSRRLAGIKKRKPRSTSSWAKLGVKPAKGGKFKFPKRRAWLLMPSGRNGPAFLVYRNFRAIMRYNNAVSYALGVAHLGDRIAGRPEFIRPWPRTGTPLAEAGRIRLQKELTRLGLYTGPITGRIGRKTERAIRKYQRSRKMKVDSYASEELLKRILSGV
ncbi:MAG: lytic murein transglycosylase [Pseudomonadota bacterium]